jgi:DNA-binding transcriptional MerR regulator
MNNAKPLPLDLALQAKSLGMTLEQAKALLTCGAQTSEQSSFKLDPANHHIVWADNKMSLKVRIRNQTIYRALPQTLPEARMERDRILVELKFLGQDFRRDMRKKGISYG